MMRAGLKSKLCPSECEVQPSGVWYTNMELTSVIFTEKGRSQITCLENIRPNRRLLKTYFVDGLSGSDAISMEWDHL